MLRLLFVLISINQILGDQIHHFLVRVDTRKCASPFCGGFWLRVNFDFFLFRIPNDSFQSLDGELNCPPESTISNYKECYVVQFSGLNDNSIPALVSGRFSELHEHSQIKNKKFYEFNVIRSFDGYGQKRNFNNGDFYEVRELGTDCKGIKPCLHIDAAKFSSKRTGLKFYQKFAGIDFSNAEKISPSVNFKKSILSYLKMIIFAQVDEEQQYLIASAVFIEVAIDADSSPVVCGANLQCEKNQFCKKKSCEEKYGTCQKRPITCTREFSPVCSCNGKREFENDCIRQLFGYPGSSIGSCSVGEVQLIQQHEGGKLIP